MDNLIEVSDLAYTYKTGSGSKVKALNGVDMTIHRGAYVAITGQNGSGKSTLARHFNALLRPQSGKVSIDRLSAGDPKNIAAIRKMVGMVFQNPDNQLISSIVEEDIAFGPENLGLSPALIHERVDWALETLKLQHLRRRSPMGLSEGQKQLVAIAGVLAMKPECIVLDEPTAHLDPRSRREVLESISRLNDDENITIILLTHFMDEVIHCNQMYVMDQGKIVLHGSPHQVFGNREMIKQVGLNYPFALQLAEQLQNRGHLLAGDIINLEELIDSICRLKLEI